MGLTRQSPADEVPGQERRSTPRTDEALLDALDAYEVEVRLRAALDLGSRDVPPGPLVEAAVTEQDVAVRSALLTAVAARDDDEAAILLADCLRSDDASLRVAVVDALVGMPRSVGTAVQRLAADWDSDLRILAVMVMSGVRDERVPGWLAHLVAHDADANVVAAALGELAEVGDQRHLDVVGEAAGRFPHDGFLQFCAAQARSSLADRTPS